MDHKNLSIFSPFPETCKDACCSHIEFQKLSSRRSLQVREGGDYWPELRKRPHRSTMNHNYHFIVWWLWYRIVHVLRDYFGYNTHHRWLCNLQGTLSEPHTCPVMFFPQSQQRNTFLHRTWSDKWARTEVILHSWQCGPARPQNSTKHKGARLHFTNHKTAHEHWTHTYIHHCN